MISESEQVRPRSHCGTQSIQQRRAPRGSLKGIVTSRLKRLIYRLHVNPA
jgi:hypothetical protein